MTPWRPDRLLKALLRWSAVTFLVFWLPAVRGPMDDRAYEWELLGFRGAGAGGD